MEKLVFSADAHIGEPADIFTSGLPASLKKYAIVADRQDGYMVTRSDDKIIHRLRLPADSNFGGLRRIGLRNLEDRYKDMALDGIDAELVFPTLGLWTFTLEDPELELATSEVYNNWAGDFFKNDLDKFVPAGILPVRDFKNTLLELKRVGEKGFTTAMIPAITPKGIPAYNSEEWDPVFHLAGELGIALAMHTGTGLETVVMETGPGAAVINYTRQMEDAINSVMYLVAGGVLDRNPKAGVATIEAGASWLGAVAERMDEVYLAHDIFVRPKLSRMPSEIIRDQVKAAFQSDKECIIARKVTGHKSIVWGSDYPHAEGTFPRSKDVIKGLFDDVDINEDEKADILGRTAAKFFGLQRPGFERDSVTA